MKKAPDVRLNVHTERDSIRLEYTVTNPSGVSIYIFDRLYDMRSEQLSPNWAYISFEKAKAIVSRQVWPLPQGLHHENPEVPYGRLLPSGSKFSGQLTLPLPLTERDPYYGIRHRDNKLSQVALSVLTFRLGWAEKSSVKAGSEVDLAGEKLVLFPYSEAIMKQNLTESAPQQTNVTGLKATPSQ